MSHDHTHPNPLSLLEARRHLRISLPLLALNHISILRILKRHIIAMLSSLAGHFS